jgi:hypothetical protein
LEGRRTQQRACAFTAAFELARKIERKKMSARDENRHLDVKREVNFRMSALIDRYWTHYGLKKRSADREKSVLEGIRTGAWKRLFVREVDGWLSALVRKPDGSSWSCRRARRCGTSTSCTT